MTLYRAIITRRVALSLLLHATVGIVIIIKVDAHVYVYMYNLRDTEHADMSFDTITSHLLCTKILKIEGILASILNTLYLYHYI